MMDMLTIVLVFLLKHFGVDEVAVMPAADLQVPSSTTEQPTRLAVHVAVSMDRVIVDGVPVVALGTRAGPDGRMVPAVAEASSDGRVIPPLHDVLERKRSDAEALAAALSGGSALPESARFEGRILVQADRRLPFDVVRRVLYTAGVAGFDDFEFVVLRQGE
jgi:hypothetical protein